MAQVTPLREALDASGLTPDELATRLDKHYTQVIKWLNGPSTPRVEMAVRIAAELDSTVEQLWPGTQAEPEQAAA